MITEPNINKFQLIETLEKEYDFSIDNITFNPKGEASWSYIVQSNNDKFFLKVFKTESFNPEVFEFTFRLFKDCGVENIVHPIKTTNDEVYFSLEGFKFVLFNFIEGKTIREQPLNDSQLESLGELLAKIHKSYEIIGPYTEKEALANQFKENILKIYEELDKFENLDEFQQQAKELYTQYKNKFLGELESLEKLADDLKKQDIEFVNCHGEPSPGNVMVSVDGKIYLIDWDFPIFAPKEKDLMFFDNKLEPVLIGYKKIFPGSEINHEVRKYYGLLWNVQEIEDWGTRLLLESHSEEENKHNLEELIHFLDYSGLK